MIAPGHKDGSKEGLPLLRSSACSKRLRRHALAGAAMTTFAIASLTFHARSTTSSVASAVSSLPAENMEGATHAWSVVISETVWSADGATYRPAIAFDGVVPGVVRRVSLGDTISVSVTNAMTTGATIHHHGIHQIGTPYYDGATGIAQAAILPGATLEYTFNAYPAGTHFYHAHMAFENADGAVGAFIVEDPSDPYAAGVALDEVVVVQDWLAGMSSSDYFTLKENINTYASVANTYLSTKSSEVYSQTALNGYAPPLDKVADSGGGVVFECEERSFVRLRIISGAWNSQHYVQLLDPFGAPAHFFVVAADGRYVKPVATSALHARAGERYDVLVDAPTAGDYLLVFAQYGHSGSVVQASGSFGGKPFSDDTGLPHRIWRPDPYDDEAPPNTDRIVPLVVPQSTFESNNTLTLRVARRDDDDDDDAVAYAELAARLSAAPRLAVVDPQNQGALTALLEFEEAPPAKADVVLPFVITAATMRKEDDDDFLPATAPSDVERWLMNGNTWMDPIVPLYVSKGEYGLSPEDTESFSTYVTTVEYEAVVDIVLINHGGGALTEFHPFHLHGNNFWVISQGHLPYAEADAYARANLVDPPLRDVIPVRTGTYAILRFRADNPGVWHFHCHLMVHMTLGLQAAFNVAPQLQPEPPCDWWRVTWPTHECHDTNVPRRL